MDRGTELLTKAKAAMMAVYTAFGRPGEYGYGTPEGKALAALYDLNNEIADELKLLAEIEAAMAEPATAEEDAAVERSWQRFKGAVDQADLLAVLRLHVAYEEMPRDRGGKAGPRARAWAAFITARDAALRGDAT